MKIYNIFTLFMALAIIGCKKKPVYEKMYANGKKHIIAELNSEGELDGDKTVYYEDGNIKSKSYFKNGKLNGYATGFYKNGVSEFITSYKNGKKHGVYREYYDNGALKAYQRFSDNIEKGKYYEFYPNGKLNSVQELMNGISNGNVLFFSEQTGKMTMLAELRNGESVFYQKYDSKGKMTYRYIGLYHEPEDTVLNIGKTYNFEIKGGGKKYYELTRIAPDTISYKAYVRGSFKIENGRYYLSLIPQKKGKAIITFYYEDGNRYYSHPFNFSIE